jgi:hypothetical protein
MYDSLPDMPYEVILLLQLHDAVYTMVEERNVDQTIIWMRQNMMIPMTCKNEQFIIDCDFKVGDSWAEGEELEINWRNEE